MGNYDTDININLMSKTFVTLSKILESDNGKYDFIFVGYNEK